MKERPILFSSSMVRALLDGRKTQTRRIVKKQISDIHKFQGWIIESTDKKRDGCASWGIGDGALVYDLIVAKCPYGKQGDRLWVRETFKQYNWIISYKADGNWISDFNDIDNFNPHENIKWKPSIHMPRSASRILLEITGVRVERLKDISEEDAMAEGVDGENEAAKIGAEWYEKPKRAYRRLWEQINGPGSWDLNPWVWVVEFRTLEIARAAA